MVAVIIEQCTISPPGDSGGGTTSGDAGEGEHRSDSGRVCVQLEGDFSNPACCGYIKGKIITQMLHTMYTLASFPGFPTVQFLIPSPNVP